jgi:putative hydrolase of the HAD superfamily
VAALKALVFDLDDTLYPEDAYVRSGFQAVARWLEAAGAMPARPAFEQLWSAHERGERGHLFDDLLAACEPAATAVTVPALVQVYRNHAPDIRFYPGMAGLLDDARARALRIAVISDGFLEAQRRKVEALGLDRWADPILLTDQWGRDHWKPCPMAFERVQEAFGLGPEQLVYVGDNPTKDFQAPNRLGWHTIRLAMPGQGPARPCIEEARRQVSGVEELRAELLG